MAECWRPDKIKTTHGCLVAMASRCFFARGPTRGDLYVDVWGSKGLIPGPLFTGQNNGSFIFIFIYIFMFLLSPAKSPSKIRCDHARKTRRWKSQEALFLTTPSPHPPRTSPRGSALDLLLNLLMPSSHADGTHPPPLNTQSCSPTSSTPFKILLQSSPWGCPLHVTVESEWNEGQTRACCILPSFSKHCAGTVCFYAVCGHWLASRSLTCTHPLARSAKAPPFTSFDMLMLTTRRRHVISHVVLTI